MSSRRTFLKQTTALGITAAVSIPVTRAAARIKSATRREETVIRYGGDGDNWHMSWAADDRQYVSQCDGVGFSTQPQAYYNSRLWAISGGPGDATFNDLPGYPLLDAITMGPKDARYYPFGTLAHDGHLYQFLSTFNIPIRKRDGLLRWSGVKLIYSPDNGRTWCNQNASTPVVWEAFEARSSENMVFWQEDQQAFSLLSVLQMGQNYASNRDGYVYVYAPNGNTEGTMNELVMFRVPKTQLLKRSAYEYYAGLTAKGNARWSPDISFRAIVHTFPRGGVNTLWHPHAWLPSVVYNESLGLYMMANWGMGTGTDIDAMLGTQADDIWFAKPSYLGLWLAPRPWGPWTQIHEEAAWIPGGDADARAFAPQIAPKWIAPDGKSFWLVWSDFQVTDKTEVGRLTREIGQTADAVEKMRLLTKRRKLMPYYAFNTQRVDLRT